MNESHARRGMKGFDLEVLDLYCKKKFQSQAHFRNDLLCFSAVSNFLSVTFMVSPPASGRKLEVIV